MRTFGERRCMMMTVPKSGNMKVLGELTGLPDGMKHSHGVNSHEFKVSPSSSQQCTAAKV